MMRKAEIIVAAKREIFSSGNGDLRAPGTVQHETVAVQVSRFPVAQMSAQCAEIARIAEHTAGWISQRQGRGTVRKAGLERMETQSVEQHLIPFSFGVIRGKQFLPIKDGIGAGQETEGLYRIRHFLSAC